MVKKIVKKKIAEDSAYAESYGNLGVLYDYSGKFISLNMASASYFGIGLLDSGDHKIWLSSQNWCDKVPDTLSPTEAEQLGRAISEGVIVVGKRWIPALNKDREVKKKYEAIPRQYRSCTKEFKDIVRELVRVKTKGNYTSTELIRAMLSKENDGDSRPDFILFLNDAIAHCAGPVSLVEDFPNDPDNYTVVVDPVSLQVISSSKKAESTEEGLSYPSEDPIVRANKIDSALE